MHVYSLLAAAALSGLTSAAPTTSTCHNYVIVSTRGTNEAQGPSAGFGGMIAATLNVVVNGTEYDTVYPAVNAKTSAPAGVVELVRYMRATVRACPQQKYLLLGYSQGAAVTVQALQQLPVDSAEGQAILGVVVIGNPQHEAFRSANVDETGGKRTDAYYGSLYTGVESGLPESWYTSNKFLDICLYNDLVCMATLSAVPIGLVNHLFYGLSPFVQEQGSNFMVNKLYLAGLSPFNATNFGVNS